MWTSVCEYYASKNYLNMSSAYLCLEWHRRMVLLTKNTEAHVTLAVFSASAASIYEDINIISIGSLRVTSWAF